MTNRNKISRRLWLNITQYSCLKTQLLWSIPQCIILDCTGTHSQQGRVQSYIAGHCENAVGVFYFIMCEIEPVNNLPTMPFYTRISRNTQSISYMLSLTECVWVFRNNDWGYSLTCPITLSPNDMLSS